MEIFLVTVTGPDGIDIDNTAAFFDVSDAEEYMVSYIREYASNGDEYTEDDFRDVLDDGYERIGNRTIELNEIYVKGDHKERD